MTRRQPKLTIERLREVLRYEPDTGKFFWLKRISNRIVRVGAETATANSWGYRVVRIDKEQFGAHRLAWFYMTEEWPPEDVDHINGDRADNRWINLRLATRSVNMQNLKRPHKDSKTGFLGVHKHRSFYRPEIMVNGVKRRLGSFATPQEAHAVYLREKARLHPGHVE